VAREGGRHLNHRRARELSHVADVGEIDDRLDGGLGDLLGDRGDVVAGALGQFPKLLGEGFLPRPGGRRLCRRRRLGLARGYFVEEAGDGHHGVADVVADSGG
jgi:hypothetical protein